MDLTCYHQWLKILDHLNIAVLLIDSQRRVQKVNASAVNLIGLGLHEIENQDCQEIFCGIPCFSVCPFQENGETDIRDMDIEFLDEANEKHRVTRVGAPLLDNDGIVRGCMTILQDHSPYSDLLNRIHYEEQSLKIILDSLNIGIFTVNRSGLMTFFNRAAEKISGFNRMKLLGRKYTTIFGETGDGEKSENTFRFALESGTTATALKGTLSSSEGEKIPVNADYIPLLNDHGKIIGGLAALQDMTLAYQLDQVISDKYSFHHMIGRAPVMQRIFELVRVVARTEATILIEGATGTGKDLLAKIIHSESRRANRPFVKINCAAIPENLLESEFFGYAKGAFTGADRDKPGRFCEAHTGTIFLDEIGDLPLSLQAKLLRVLEDMEFYPLGSRKTKKVDVRIISATNRGLEQLVEKKLFREDLYYRLNVMRIDLPPLVERKADLPLLIRHILRKLSATMDKPHIEICEEAMRVLLNYSYPGNIRELENIIEHALIICQGDVINSLHLPIYLLEQRHGKRHKVCLDDDEKETLNGTDGDWEIENTPLEGIRKNIGNNEKKRILAILEEHDWHRGRTATSLKMDRSTLWRKMKKYGLQ
ncbi:Sigma-54 dependent transcriptional regulator (PAS domain protein) [Desulfamplus magnetovallimortis]|uniref:Sigma-54 dependent transcriptional regulator (PAS domain protein) n=1 Tax=Desulfamplus magnetovallimortis TaxID=1246637 RepID=A0A1W1H6I8_9BACT|nr:sigma 54-interacting transcriptional regulator [Desulfamplus magnetovallimortis]SLM28072.1 Sigma-54 dependent transcriptional regulator (PAS domain protein) [Desulfamplus magnetovallimortis]